MYCSLLIIQKQFILLIKLLGINTFLIIWLIQHAKEREEDAAFRFAFFLL